MIDRLSQFAATCEAKSDFIFPTWYKYISKDEKASAESGRCELAFKFPDDISAILLAIVEILLRIGIFAAVGFIIYGGILYMTSQGEPDKAANAQKTIINAVVGLIITIIATGAVSFIGGQLTR